MIILEQMDSGLVIVTFITFVYIVIMFTLLFYVKYEWCDLLYKNNTVRVSSALAVLNRSCSSSKKVAPESAVLLRGGNK